MQGVLNWTFNIVTTHGTDGAGYANWDITGQWSSGLVFSEGARRSCHARIYPLDWLWIVF